MTKDYEADSIADETRRDVERRMQSPYTRAEFVAREVRAGIDAQGRAATTPQGTQVKVVDQDTGAAIRQRAELNAQAAERAGITWRRTRGTARLVDEAVDMAVGLDAGQGNDEPLVDWLNERVVDHEGGIADHERRLSLQLERITELANRVNGLSYLESTYAAHADRISRLESDDNDLADRTSELETSIGGIDQRVTALHQVADARQKGLVLRILMLESASNVNVLQRIERVESEWKVEGLKDLESLRGQVEQLIGKVDDAHDLATSTWNSLHSKAFREEGDSPGLIDVVRRLDADMALIRDAVCPPQGTAPDEPAQISVDDPAYRGRIERARFEFVGLELARMTQAPTIDWPDLTPTMLESPVFEAIWQTIKSWDIAVPGAYSGYRGATGNHVRAILDAIEGRTGGENSLVTALGRRSEHLRQTRDALRAACLELGADATWSDDTNLADVVSKVLMPAVRGRIASEGLAERAGIVKWLRIIGEYVGPGDVTPTAYRRSADRIEAGVHWKDLNQV